MNQLTIFISGYHEEEFDYKSLFYHQSCFVELFKLFKLNYICYCIKNKTDFDKIFDEIKKTNFNKILIIYTGHGDGNTSTEYPAICPMNKSFFIDLNYGIKNNQNEIINFSYIYDCCNRSNFSLPFIQNINQQQLDQLKENLIKFLNFDFRYICFKKGLLNYTRGSYTIMNQVLIDVLLNYEYDNFEDYLCVCNYLLLNIYKNENKIQNKKVKHVLDSNINFNKSKYTIQNKPIKRTKF